MSLQKHNDIEYYIFSGKGSQKKCIEAHPDFFHIGQDISFTNPIGKKKISKQYLAFKNIEDFYVYEQTFQQDNRNFYETLIKDKPRVEIYDIDGDITLKEFQNEDGTRLSDEQIISTFIIARIDFQETYYSDIKINQNNFIIKKTDDPKNEKISFHILVRNGYAFKNLNDHLIFVKKFLNHLKEERYNIRIDMSIYSSNRLIRMLGNQKLGQTGRFAYRYPDFSMFNGMCDDKLFISTYLLGNEKYYTFDEKEKEKQELNLFKPMIPLDDADRTENKVGLLVNLILELVDNKTSLLCDEEIKNKMNYGVWWKFVVTVFNSFQDSSLVEDQCYNIYQKLFSYYRHKEQINSLDYFKNLFSKRGEYQQLTISSLHYFARANLKYTDMFKEEIEKYNKKFKLAKYTAELKRAIKIQEINTTLPIQYVHEVPTLNKFSLFNCYTEKYIHKIINSIFCNVIMGGENSIFCKDTYYCNYSNKKLETYKQVKYEKLCKKSGIFTTVVRIINLSFLEELQQFESSGGKLDKKKKPPVQYNYVELVKIVDDMFPKNLMTTYNKPIFKPYLNKNDKEANLCKYKDCLNLFNGFAFSKNDVSIELYKNSHIRENLRKYLCNGDVEPDNFKYIEQHTAHMIQKPYERCDMAILIVGQQGTGKDIWTNFLSKLIGLEYYLDVANIDNFFKNFNSNQQKKLLTKLNEISDKGVHFEKHNVFKEKITALQVCIEPKGFESYNVDHLSRYYGFSQSESIVNVEHSDRRFFMIKTNNSMANNATYMKPILEELKNTELLQSAFNYYATLNIEGFNTRVFPNTTFKDEQKIQSLSNSHKFLYHLFEETPNKRYKKHSDEVYVDFVSWCIKMGISQKYLVNRLNFFKSLVDLNIVEKRITINDKKKNGVDITSEFLEIAFRKYMKNDEFELKTYKD